MIALFLVLVLSLLQTQAVDLNDGKHGKIVSEKALVKVSTTSSADAPEKHLNLVRGPRKEFAFHTAEEKNPWVILKLPRAVDVAGLHIINRTNPAFYSRAAGLTVSLSTDGKTWREVWKASRPEAEWKVSLLATTKDRRALYVRLELKPEKPQHLHLSRVTLYGQ